jgi:non-heme chloroperoxidase
MPFATAKDKTRIFYKDGGIGQPIVFSHGWPLTADAWDSQILFFGQRGYRVIAHDRRSHGRSDKTWDHNSMDTYAGDLKAVIDHLDLKDAILIGHSTGGGEVARYIGRYGTSRVAKAILVSAVPPLMLQTAKNPEGTPKEAFDSIRQGVANNRSQYFKDLAMPFYGFNRDGAHISQGLIDSFWLQGMMGGIKGIYDCIREFSEVDYTDDLRKFDCPTLFIHGDDDQIVPIGAAALKAHKIVKGAELKVYPGAPHGLAQTMPDRFNSEVLEFLQGAQQASAAGA